VPPGPPPARPRVPKWRSQLRVGSQHPCRCVISWQRGRDGPGTGSCHRSAGHSRGSAREINPTSGRQFALSRRTHPSQGGRPAVRHSLLAGARWSSGGLKQARNICGGLSGPFLTISLDNQLAANSREDHGAKKRSPLKTRSPARSPPINRKRAVSDCAGGAGGATRTHPFGWARGRPQR